METWLQNEGFHQYLILRAEHADIDSFEMNMLIRYEGRKLLPLELQCKNGEVNISYEISGAVSLQQDFQTKEMDGNMLEKLFSSVWECYEELEAYLLPIEGILLQPEQIYYQPGKKQIRFCYLPGYREAFHSGFLSLVEFCMKRTKHQDSEAVLFIYGLYRLLQEGNAEREELKKYMMDFSMEHSEAEGRKQTMPDKQFSDTGGEAPSYKAGEEQEAYEIHNLKPDRETKERREVLFQSNGIRRKAFGLTGYIYGGLSLLTVLMGLISGIRFLVVSHRETDIKTCIIMIILTFLFVYSMMRSRKKDAGQEDRTEIMNEEKEDLIPIISRDILEEEAPPSIGMDETSVLTAAVNSETAIWELESKQMHVSNIQLNDLPGVLGRKLDEVDYVVSGEGISRRHLMLFQSGEDLYAEDLASTNGTYINGIRMKAGEPVKLCDGDQLSIGPNQYQVRRKH